MLVNAVDSANVTECGTGAVFDLEVISTIVDDDFVFFGDASSTGHLKGLFDVPLSSAE